MAAMKEAVSFAQRVAIPRRRLRARKTFSMTCRALKRRRGIATPYAKLTASFIAAIHVRCLFLYLPVHTA
jgi:hypothetical protein